MTDTTAQIKGKGLDSTGVTEEVARSYFDHLGSHHIAIVEYRVDSRSVDADGKQKVQLSLTQVEPVIDGDLNGRVVDVVRNIQRALWRNRGEDVPLEGIDGDNEPTVAEVQAAAEALVERDESGEVVGLWDGDTEEEPPTEGEANAADAPLLDEEQSEDPQDPEDEEDGRGGNVHTIGSPFARTDA